MGILAYMFTGLLVALYFFQTNSNTSAVLGSALGVVVGAACGISQGKRNPQINSGNTTTETKEPGASE